MLKKEVLETLDSTPEKIRREIASLLPRHLKARPAPNKWSVQEILAHLDDVEELGMRARVVAMIEEDEPLLLPFDQEKRATEQKYRQRNPQSSLDHLTRQRKANVKWLHTLKPAQLRRKGHHELAGEITAEEMIHEWAFHDLGHLKQILEVKRYALWPKMGNMRQFYKLE
jgi:hypothetical protein